MVARSFFALAFLPCWLIAGEFVASVDQTEIPSGESFTLYLVLKEASAKGLPQLSPLKSSFLIHSEHQSSNTMIVNGSVSSSTTWKLLLLPLKEENLEVPSLRIETSEGSLSTQPIPLRIAHGKRSQEVDSSDLEGVRLTAEVSNDKPYKNEPFVYTIRLASRRALANIQLRKFEVEDAIVESAGEPKVYDKVINGVHVDVVDLTYLITPLKPGTLQIPSAVIQGGVPAKRKPYGGGGSMDPIFMMQGFERLEPFVLKTNEISVDVQPAVAGMVPWIPAKELNIEEILEEGTSLRVGEPFTRTFKVVAEGVRSGQLPSLSSQAASPAFKVYADNPETGDDLKDGKIKSFRKELYTLIPQQAGEVELPEASIVWWDAAKEEKSVAKVPARTLHVLPLAAAPPENPPSHHVSESESIAEAQVSSQTSSFLYGVIAALSLLLAGAIAFGVHLQRKMARLQSLGPTSKPSVSIVQQEQRKPKAVSSKKRTWLPWKKKSAKKEKKEKLPDLNPT